MEKNAEDTKDNGEDIFGKRKVAEMKKGRQRDKEDPSQ